MKGTRNDSFLDNIIMQPLFGKAKRPRKKQNTITGYLSENISAEDIMKGK